MKQSACYLAILQRKKELHYFQCILLSCRLLGLVSITKLYFLLQRTRAIEAIDASNAARREKKRKCNRDRDESIRVAEVFNGRRDQLVGIDLKGRVRLVGIVRPRRRESHANMASASAALPPVVAGAGAGAAESMTDEDPSSD